MCFFFGAKLLQLVVVAHTLVERVESHTLRGEAVGSAARGLQNVVWVQLLTELNAASAGGRKGGAAVLSKGPQPKATRASPKRCLRPLTVVGVETGELFEAAPNLLIEAGDSSRVEARGDSSDGENHCA